MNLTPEQALEMERRMRAEIDGGPLVKLRPDPVKVDISMKPIKVPKPRMNKTETRFAQWLEIQKRCGEIEWWEFQPMTFRIADDCRYTPDFVVCDFNGRLKCIDIKGSKRKKSDGSTTYWCEEDAKIKIKVAAKKFPFFDWSIYHPLPNGEWQEVAF